mmetsp:Transcript_52499/g.61300  ORF Transcript_52499/g.61300 Transcript_52499/m.61300 type:complete len:81 (+) Transcript_52499:158-400(+)
MKELISADKTRDCSKYHCDDVSSSNLLYVYCTDQDINYLNNNKYTQQILSGKITNIFLIVLNPGEEDLPQCILFFMCKMM